MHYGDAARDAALIFAAVIFSPPETGESESGIYRAELTGQDLLPHQHRLFLYVVTADLLASSTKGNQPYLNRSASL